MATWPRSLLAMVTLTLFTAACGGSSNDSFPDDSMELGGEVIAIGNVTVYYAEGDRSVCFCEGADAASACGRYVCFAFHVDPTRSDEFPVGRWTNIDPSSFWVVTENPGTGRRDLPGACEGYLDIGGTQGVRLDVDARLEWGYEDRPVVRVKYSGEYDYLEGY